MAPNEVVFVTCVLIALFLVRHTYRRIKEVEDNMRIDEAIDRQLKIYNDHIIHLESGIEDRDAKINTLLKENFELKNINQTMLKDNTYLRDKLNSEKKW